jgi:hypothetical protein
VAADDWKSAEDKAVSRQVYLAGLIGSIIMKILPVI